MIEHVTNEAWMTKTTTTTTTSSTTTTTTTTATTTTTGVPVVPKHREHPLCVYQSGIILSAWTS